MTSTFLVACLFAVAEGPFASGATNTWPGFRGGADGATAAKKLPLKWSEKEGIAWKVDLPGYGQSCPVVWKDKVIVTAVEGEQRENGMIAAYDAATGKQVWIHSFEPTQKAKWSFTISRAAPTPVIDTERVYAFFEGGNIFALTHEGKPLWSRSLFKEYGEFQNNHGLGSSLAQTDAALFVLVDHRGPSYLLALDKKTGKTNWKTERKSRGSWTSPIVIERGGKSEVVVSSNGSVAGYDAKSGEMLWEKEGISGNTLPSASYAGDNRILVGAGMGRMQGDPKDASKSNCCIKLAEKNGRVTSEVVWTATKAVSNYATPLAHRGHAYFINSVGVVFCHDLNSGEERYTERIDGPCWASPIGAGDHIYFFGKDGRTSVLKSGATFEVVATNRLWQSEKKAVGPEKEKEPLEKKDGRGGSGEYLDPIVYGVAAVDSAFFIRTGTALYRVGKP